MINNKIIWGIVLVVLLGLGIRFALMTHEISIEKDITTIQAEVTAYNAEATQTDSTPLIMASGVNVYLGAIACPEWLKFGQRVRVLGEDRIYICEDRMNKRYRKGNFFDILMVNKAEAKEFGRRQLTLEIL